MRLMRVGCAVVVLLLPLAVRGQPEGPRAGTLIGEEKRARDELDAADRLAASKRYDDAVRRYQQILVDSGDALVSLEPADARRALPVRWLVHERIAALPPEGRKLFRAAVEDTAKRWLEEGKAKRDARLLEQVVADAFVSASAEKALHLLGDLAFERGEFAVAEHYWRMLARYPSAAAAKPAPKSFALVHPDSSDGGALAQGKLILALIFRGEKTAATTELEQFRKQHAAADGEFAGRTGNYADALQAILAGDTRLATAAAAGDPAWSTFAGEASRNHVVPAPEVPYWPDTPNWVATLPGDPKAKPRDNDPPLGTGSSARSLAFHPVIVPGYALVADAARVFAYELATGSLAAEYDHRKNAGLPGSLDLRVPSRSDATYTLTVAADRVYARFGVQAMKPPDANAKPKELESAIACLGMQRGEDGQLKLGLRWQIRARVLDTDPAAIYEGAPLVRDGRLYVVRTRFEGRQAVAAVECYDADGAEGRSEPPARRWRQEVWGADPGGETVRQRHDLLTLAGPNVVYCTHSGAIVALDAATGRRAWAYRYPQAGRTPELTLPRDLCPCVYAEGRVYAAPADGDRILCLDARSGELVWEQPALVVQLLGVSRGRLFATIGGGPPSLRAYASASGGELWRAPDDGSGQATFGRGFLSDRFVFWPTRTGLRVLRQDDGGQADAGSSAAPWGNLALGEGHLIVATPTELWGFVPPRAEVGRWRHEAAERPDDAEALYRLALAEADGGDFDLAAGYFHRAAELAGTRRLHGWALRELAEHRRFEMLLIKAERLWNADEKDAARALLRDASGEAFPLADRVRAWALRRHAGDNTTPDLLDSPKLRLLWVTRHDGLPQRADDFLKDAKARDSVRARDPAKAAQARPPDIPIPLRVSASVDLLPLRERLLTPFRDPATGDEGPPADAEGRVFFGGPRRAICRTLDTGKVAWSVELRPEATECGFAGDSVIVAGPDGVSCFDRSNGRLKWQFLPPDLSPMPNRFPEALFRRLEPWPTREALSAFRLSASRLFLRHGPRTLLALDAETGRALWQFRGPGSSLGEHFLAAPEQVLLQSDDELLGLSTADGRLMYRRSAPLAWPQPPLLIEPGRAVYAEGPRLHAIDLDTATERWTYAPAGPSSLSGTVEFRRDGNDLVLLVGRNYGYELERVQLADGKQNLRPQFLGRDHPDLLRAAITPDMYAIPIGGDIVALATGNGGQRWTLKLPRAGDEPWRVRASRSALLLHAEQAVPRSAVDAMTSRAARQLDGLPTLGGLQSAASMLYFTWSRRTFPLLAVSPADGRRLQEIALPANGPHATVILCDRPAIITGWRMDLIKR
jgi:outer membrane protein assembly factor BamB/tetratricopeptide (TPR) repeat protein